MVQSDNETGDRLPAAARISRKGRIHLMDEIRGLCVLLMIFYHAFYTMSMLFHWELGTKLLVFFSPAEPFFAGLFILISGISSQLSHSNLIRGLKLLGVALALTLVTNIIVQVLKSLLKKNPEISFDKEKFIVVSPDEGAMNRNMYFSSVLGCNLGMFYKRRDYTRVVNGRNPIVAHEYLGDSVEGKTVFIADDIIASGESMLEVAGNLKERGAARIIANATFPLFTSGLKKFDQAVADGKLDYVVGTNLTYRQPELLTRDWYVDVDVSKYAAYFVVALNHDMSVSSIIDPIKKIEALLAKRG